MRKIHRLHKYAALVSGVVLALLGLSGFLLNHDGWDFLYKIRLSHYPESIKHYDKRLVNGYIQKDGRVYVAGMRGVSLCDETTHCTQILDTPVFKMLQHKDDIFLATTRGVLKNFKPYILEGKRVTSLSVADETLIAVEEKRYLYFYNMKSDVLEQKGSLQIDTDLLKEDITLSRFVRDLHYGRGIFDGDYSLFLNDYGALVLLFLALSGYGIYILIRLKKGKMARKIIKMHSNVFALLAIFPLLILLATGIVLDHSSFLTPFLKNISLQNRFLPPVYHTLEADIWDVDYDAKKIRIANRYGVYESEDLKNWKLVSKGFAYKLMRYDEKLFVSGMGAPNRYLDTNGVWQVLPNAPHMFKAVVKANKGYIYFSSHSHTPHFTVPSYNDITLYSIVLSMHDGHFFAAWWVWINDIASLLLLIVLITGAVKYIHVKRNSL